MRPEIEERLRARTAECREAERASDRLGNLRLGLALVTLVLVILPLFIKEGWPWWSLIGVAAVFLYLGKRHDLASSRLRRLRAAVRFYQRAVDVEAERWRSFPDDGRDLPEALRNRVVYSDDLDLFGPASLFQLLTTASTHLGRRRLAEYLVTPADRDTILGRQAAVRELKEKLDVREGLATSAAGEDPTPLDDAQLLAWAEGASPVPFASGLRILGVAQPLFLVAAALVYALLDRFGVLLAVAVGAHLVTLVVTRRIIAQRANVLAGPDRVLSRYASIIRQIERFELSAPLLSERRGALVVAEGQGQAASAQIDRLAGLVNLLDARLNAFFALSVSPVLLWELNLVLRAEQLREGMAPKLRGWLEAIADFEALSALGGFLDAREDYVLPEIVEGPVFEADGLAHPLIDRRRVVANDLTLGGPGSVLLLSGSNMSGKSTLLRAVGIASVLARAGAPVAARALRIGTFELATSVRIVDSLAAGTSHFYAELKRLKHVVDRAQGPGEPLLYLLDEVLHGTNSRERYIGAVSVIRWLSEHGAIGIVTTHDLALARVEEQLEPGRVRNMHFSDEVEGGEIRFDYRLRSGPVSSTNALRLMRAVGIDVEYRDLPA